MIGKVKFLPDVNWNRMMAQYYQKGESKMDLAKGTAPLMNALRDYENLQKSREKTVQELERIKNDQEQLLKAEIAITRKIAEAVDGQDCCVKIGKTVYEISCFEGTDKDGQFPNCHVQTKDVIELKP
jgi:hypothetical protein